MFALTESMHYFLCPCYVDMQSGIDSLYLLAKGKMGRNPLSGEVFLFVSKNRKQMKVLHWEKSGFILYHKRLEEGTFEVPHFQPAQGAYPLSWTQFILIMEGVSLQTAKLRKRFISALNI
jgi:transposase